MQLTKLPVFLIHYFEHKEHSPELGFLEYVNSHYLEESPEGHHHERDHDLPFKSHGDACHFAALSLPVEHPENTLFYPVTHCKSFNASVEPVFYSSFYADIWHPPQLG